MRDITMDWLFDVDSEENKVIVKWSHLRLYLSLYITKFQVFIFKSILK